jgi:hypothetical protein
MRFVPTGTEPLPPADDVPAVPLLDRLFPALDRLAASPFTLVCVMLAVNAVAQPYLGLCHDARLYAVQVVEQIRPGTYGQDLYLLYGSQDRYSVFTRLLTLLVAALGVHLSFFLVYLASKALLFWAAVRLIVALVPDRTAVALGAVFVALAAVPYGGNEIFHVNESFLTPRLAACALVLFGLEQVLAGRPVRSLLFLVGALVMHPLMAVGGLLTWTTYFLSRRLTGRQLAGLALLLVGAAVFVLARQSLATRIFGHLDDDWLDVILQICFFIRPAAWSAMDWVRIAWGFVVFVAAVSGFARSSARFLLAVVATALIGLVGSVVAVQTHYLLLVIGSPYRALWLLEFLALPLGFAWVVHLWRRGTPGGRAAALALLPLAAIDWDVQAVTGLGLFVFAFLVLTVFHRGLGRQPRRPDWLWPTAQAGFVIGFALMTAYDGFVLAVLVFVRPDPALNLDVHPVNVLQAASRTLFQLPLLVACCFAAGRVVGTFGSPRRARVALLAAWAGYHALLFGLSLSPWYGRTFSRDYRQMEFVAYHLRQLPDVPKHGATVYWHTDMRVIWFDLGARSYCNWVQMSGCGFNRGTAIEGRRRAQLVRKFELEAVRSAPPLQPWWAAAYRRYYAPADDGPPTREDLLALCRDERLDFVAVEQEFEGLSCASDGRLYLYDCRRLRATMRGKGKE